MEKDKADIEKLVVEVLFLQGLEQRLPQWSECCENISDI